MVTKRQLGLLLLAAGALTLAASLAIDLVRTGQWQGLGPYQLTGAVGGLALALLGLSLLPLGNRPA